MLVISTQSAQENIWKNINVNYFMWKGILYMKIELFYPKLNITTTLPIRRLTRRAAFYTILKEMKLM